MSEPQTEKKRPEIKGKVLAIMPEWRNNTGTFWKQEVIIETGLRYPNPVKVVFQKEGTSHVEGLKEGDCVIVPYVINGHEYNDTNGTQYFVDIVGMGLQKIVSAEAKRIAEIKAAAAQPKPVLGCTAATAIEEWAKNHGDDKAGFAEFCKQLKPGKASKTYTLGDWAEVVNAIRQADEAAAAAAAAPADDTGTDELLF